jgi:hypothetical protein
MKFIFYPDPPLDTKYTEEIAKKLHYINSDIDNFFIKQENNIIQGIELNFQKEFSLNQDLLKSNLNQMIKDVVKRGLSSNRKVWENDSNSSHNHDIFDELIEKRLVFVPHRGLAALGPLLIKLFNYFDNEIKRIVIDEYSGIEYQYPTLIPLSVIKKINYIRNFPHFFMGVSRLHNDLNNYNAFLDENEENNDFENYFYDYCSGMELCLPPTMCYHTYHQFGNSMLNSGENYVITSKGKSFRYETKYAKGLERLWDFTIREIVFMGEMDFVNRQRTNFMDRIFILFEELGFRGFCEVANDPFFITDTGTMRHISQKILELKYECRFTIDENKTIAIGSFNFHDNYFGKSFNIKDPLGTEVITACAGFGLERLVYAFLCQYGLDRSNWPDRIQRYFKTIM